MTPKEKAQELYHKYFSMIIIESPIDKVSSIPYVKKCALIVVDEILKLDNPNSYNYLTENKEHLIVQLSNNYWQEVKQEIENL